MAALDSKEYLIESLEELRRHAKKKLKESRKLWKESRKYAKRGSGSYAERMWQKAEELEKEARQDFATIQELLADERLNQ